MKLRRILITVTCMFVVWDTAASAAVNTAAVTLTGQEPVRLIAVANPATGMALVTNAGRDRISVRTADGTATHNGYCIELGAPITVGTNYTVATASGTDSPLPQAVRRNIARMLAPADTRIAAAPDRSIEAAATQLAVWRLLDETRGEIADMTDPTLSVAIADRASELVSYAQTPPPLPDAPPALTINAATVCAGTQVRVSVLTTPLTQLHLTTTAGAFPNGTAGTTITTDAFGAGETTLTATANGAGTVTATVTGGELVVTQRPSGQAPQNLAWFEPHTYTSIAAITVTDCTATAQTLQPEPAPRPTSATATPLTLTPAPTAPAPTPRQATAVPLGQPTPIPSRSLTLRKRGPRRVTAGKPATYTLTVTNTGNTTLTAVTVTDRVPANLHVRRLPAGARMSRSAVLITIGRLAPGERRVVRLDLAADTTAAGCLTNHATATATDTPAAHAEARTCITAAPRPEPVPVTG